MWEGVYMHRADRLIHWNRMQRTWTTSTFVSIAQVRSGSTESGHRIKFHESQVLPKTSGYMDWLVNEAIEIKLHPENMNREEGFKPSKAWNPSTRLCGHSNTHTSRKCQEDTEKSLLKRKQNNWQQGHQVKQHGDRIESDGWPHSLTTPSCCIVHQ
jgi:hypothetical protein